MASVILLTCVQVCFIGTLYMAWQMRKMRHELTEARMHAIAAMHFANLLAERGLGLVCDDCGNVMTHDQQIDVIQRKDGSTYIGHRSHDRRHDWGMAP